MPGLALPVGLFMLAFLQTAGAVPADARVEAELARGACSTAARLAAEALGATTGGAARADALALRSRVALECGEPEATGLVEGLDEEEALRARLEGADSPGVAGVELARIQRLLLQRRNDEALAAARVLAARAEQGEWPAALRGRIAQHTAWAGVLKADPELALVQSGEAIELARAAGDEETRIRATEHRAWTLVQVGREREALALLDEVVPLAERRHGAGSRQYARILRTRGQTARMLGDHGRAIADLQRALSLQQQMVEPDPRLLAVYWLNLGQAHKAAGDLQNARIDYEHALAAEARSPTHAGPLRAQLLHSLANLERDLGNPRRAVELHGEALPGLEQAYGAGSRYVATLVNNRGDAYALLGEYAAARADYERAAAIARKLGSRDPADYLPLANLARLELWQGHFAEAEVGFREALRAMGPASAGSEGSPIYAWMGLAASLWGEQRLGAALDAALTAERTRQAALRLAASHLGEEGAVDFQEYQEPSLELALAIAAASARPDDLARVWQASMAARDQVTTIQAQRLAAARNDPALAGDWAEWREASAALARSELAGEDAPALEVARRRLGRAERALARATSLGTVQGAGEIDLAGLRGSLPGDTALVLFATSRLGAPGDFDRADAATRAPRSFALVLPAAEAPPQVVPLGSTAAIETAIDAWNAALADRGVALASVRERGEAVRKLLLEPIRRATSARRLLVIPEGAIHRLPWAALPDGEGWLVEQGMVVHALNHERELLAPPPRTPRSGLVALADPALGGTASPLRQACRARLGPLPGARRESIELDALWRRHFGARAQSVLLLGAEATEGRLRGAVATSDVLHFGTHGIRLDADCQDNAKVPTLATRGFALVADAPLDPGAPAVAPAALLLAPGDAAGTDDDGVLTAAEITALDLSGTRWVVLAACSTAAGATHRYEGQFGLARAFRLAGARSVITSLWAVDDAATAEWTRALYVARLERGLDTASAMTQAQRAVLAARRARGDSTHPYYWAAFLASGDWR